MVKVCVFLPLGNEKGRGTFHAKGFWILSCFSTFQLELKWMQNIESDSCGERAAWPPMNSDAKYAVSGAEMDLVYEIRQNFWWTQPLKLLLRSCVRVLCFVAFDFSPFILRSFEWLRGVSVYIIRAANIMSSKTSLLLEFTNLNWKINSFHRFHASTNANTFGWVES